MGWCFSTRYGVLTVILVFPDIAGFQLKSYYWRQMITNLNVSKFIFQKYLVKFTVVENWEKINIRSCEQAQLFHFVSFTRLLLYVFCKIGHFSFLLPTCLLNLSVFWAPENIMLQYWRSVWFITLFFPLFVYIWDYHIQYMHICNAWLVITKARKKAIR